MEDVCYLANQELPFRRHDWECKILNKIVLWDFWISWTILTKFLKIIRIQILLLNVQ